MSLASATNTIQQFLTALVSGNFFKTNSAGEYGINNITEISKNFSPKPEYAAGGTIAVALAASGVGQGGDLSTYGYPYKTFTLTESGGVNSATYTLSLSSRFGILEITGTGTISLSATNYLDAAISYVPVLDLAGANPLNPVQGVNLGAGTYILYKL